MDFFDRFRQFSKVQNIPADVPILLAVSGGLDSMVMVNLFQEAGSIFGIAHCNFQLRGAESDGDEMLVQELAATLDVPFFTKRFETKMYAEKNGISTQMAARDLRYAWFAEIAEQHQYPYLATAHHLNDSVETALLNYIRGTGLAGLSGIRNSEFRTPNSTFLTRPLLFATREEILEYAQANGIAWREDSSNASDDYARNFLRHHIVPKMEELNPNFLHTAERNMLNFKETKDNLDFLTTQFLGIEEADGDGFSISKQKLAQLPAPRRVLGEILKPHGFTEEQARQLAENLDHVGFELPSESGWRVLCDRLKILVQHPSAPIYVPVTIIQKEDLMIRLPDGTSLFFMEADPIPPFPDGMQAVLVDGATIQYPLTVRLWKEGDAFQPFGMGGQSQKLQDFFTNQKLSRFEKEQVWLLLNGDGAVVWVVGMRLDERFRVREGTVAGLKIHVS